MPSDTERSVSEPRISLENQVVIVTGASRGLGVAYAKALANHGAKLVLTARNESALDAVTGEFEHAVSATGDVSDPAFAAAAVELATSSFGRVDVLVNNAGGLRDRTLLRMTDDEFDEVLQSHVYGCFYLTREVARLMRDQGGGSVINIGSDSGFKGAFGQTNYAAAKGAVMGMTLTWATELQRHGISCNCVLPNALTAMTEGLDEVLEEYRYGPPECFPRGLGEPSEVAPLVVLLASERWRGLNGWLLSLGGDKLSLWNPPEEVRTAFMQGGWSVSELDRSMAFALGKAFGPESPEGDRTR